MTARLTPDESDGLLSLARAAIAEQLFADGALVLARGAVVVTPALASLRACFVTLEAPDREGVLRLRGCVGSTEARLPAHEAVIESARDAAFADPRFTPVGREEFPEVVVSVSILTPMLPVPDVAAIVAGRDGVRLAFEGRQALFLPEVALDHGWSRDELLEQLARKAGLPPAAWRKARLLTFQTERFGENGSTAARISRS
jgi:AmmeMemoRadiSam system protein A